MMLHIIKSYISGFTSIGQKIVVAGLALAVTIVLLTASFLEVYAASGLPIPRFVSLASDEVNMRTGPGQRYPIDWVFYKENLPVEIINEFDIWRKARDVTGHEGWVHHSLLSSVRYAIIQEKKAVLFALPQSDADRIAILEPGVMVDVKRCDREWCEIEAEDFNGWVEKPALWGVYEDEIIE